MFETALDYSASTDSLRFKMPPVEDLLDRRPKAVSAGVTTDSGQSQPGEYLLYCYVDATNVSFTKHSGEGFLTSLLTLGEDASHPVSGANISYQLYDLQNDLIVLSDERIMVDKDIDEDNIADLLEDMPEGIPAKIK